MGAIFISHSSADNDTARVVADWLQASGHKSIFLDFDPEAGIPAGRDWEQELYRSIRTCRAVIVLCSRKSMESRWCFMEITHARALGKHIFPIRIEDCEVDGILADNQVIDLAPEQMAAFARLEVGLLAAGLDPNDMFGWDPKRSPYPGLSSFHEADAGIFFGRDREIGDGLDALGRLRRLGTTPFMMVLGASGSGKSSLVRAGILPRLKRDHSKWIVLDPFRPRSEPLREMAASISRAFDDLDETRPRRELAERLRAGAASWNPGGPNPIIELTEDLRRASGNDDARVLMTIDQFEELLGHPSSHPSTIALRIIRDAIDAQDTPVVLIGTMRSDFLGSLQQHPALIGIEFTSLGLGPMAYGDLVQVIAKPAEVAGIDLEDGLAEEIAADADSDDALPLLAFALREMSDRFADDMRIDLREYRDSLGGLHGSIAGVADDLLRSQRPSPAELDDLRRAFLAMVRIGDDGGFARMPVNWDDLPEAAHPILTRFVDARLLVAGADPDGDTRTVEVAHEALFRSWDQLRRWLDEGAAILSLRRDLTQAATQWDDNDRSADHLWRGGRLEIASEMVDSPDMPIDALITDFVDAGRAGAVAEHRERARRRRRQIVGGIAAAVILAIAGIGFGIVQLRNKQNLADANGQLGAANKQLANKTTEAETARAAAEAARAAAETLSILALATASQSDAALGGPREIDAVVEALSATAAYESLTDPTVELTRQITASLSASQSAHLQNRLDGLSGVIVSVASDPKTGSFGATDDLGFAQIWNRRGESIATFEIPGGTVWSATISPDLARVAVLQSPVGETGAGPDTPLTLAVYLIDGSGSKELHTEPGFWTSDLTFAGPDVVASRAETEPRYWDLEGNEIAWTGVDPFTNDATDADVPLIGPDGSVAEIDSTDDSVVRFTDTDGTTLTFDTGGAFVSAWGFDSDGRLAVGLRDGTVQIWNPAGVRSRPTVFDAPFGWEIAVADDGETWSAEDGGALSEWSADGVFVNRWTGPDGNGVPMVAHDPTGGLIFLGTDDVVRYWPNSDISNEPEEITGLNGIVLDVGFGVDGEPLITLVDGDVSLIADRSGDILWESDPIGDDILRASGSPTGAGAVMVDVGGNFVMATPDGELFDLDGHPQFGFEIVWAADGSRVATRSADGAIQAWTFDGQRLARFQLAPNGGATTGWFPDGSHLGATDDDGITRIWNIDTGAQVGDYRTGIKADNPWSLKFSAMGTAVLSSNTGIRSWHLDDFASLRSNACNWIADYLSTNPTVLEDERTLCRS